MAASAEPPSSKPGHRTRNRVIVVVIVVVVVAALIALSTIPVTHSFSLTVPSYFDYQQSHQPAQPPPGATLSPPTGSHVWGTFSTDGGAAVFEIIDSYGLVYLANSSCGTFSFTTAPPIWFYVFAGPSVNVSGQYSSPIL